MTVCPVLQEPGIVDDGMVLTGMLDGAARASGQALGEFLSGDLSCADVDAVDS